MPDDPPQVGQRYDTELGRMRVESVRSAPARAECGPVVMLLAEDSSYSISACWSCIQQRFEKLERVA